jgi:hypothetical protein
VRSFFLPADLFVLGSDQVSDEGVDLADEIRLLRNNTIMGYTYTQSDRLRWVGLGLKPNFLIYLVKHKPDPDLSLMY